MTTYAVRTDRKRVNDVLKNYYEERYNFVAGTIKNVCGETIDAGSIVVGAPLSLNGTQWETLLSTEEANAEGFFMDDRITPELANNGITPLKYRILVCGPAVANPEQIGSDPLGDAYVTATMKTKMLALSPPIKTQTDPPETEEQTT